MTNKISIMIFVLLLSCAACVGQTAFHGLTPGKSTKADVEKALGRAVRQLSETLSEYKSRGTEQIFVQYVGGSGEVARIEATYPEAIERSSALGSVNLPARSMGWQVNPKQRLEEYFSAACVVLTYVGADASSGVSRIGYYSRQLFENASSKLPRASLGKNPPGLNRLSDGANNSGGGQPAKPPAANYDDLVARANGAMQASDFQTAIRLSQQAVDLDPNRAGAYEIAGIAQLYGLKDVNAAATAMQAAVQHGGSASFTVSHDHDGVFQTYCQGSLFITNGTVNYRSNDGAHSFLFSRTDLKEIGLNKLIGAKFYSFHIKAKTKNFNFAPGTLSAGESNLIVALLKSTD
jgi:tetratricopeptide (TPR) repeat protein